MFRTLPFPREHGAWGILLVPPVVTALALGQWPARMWLLMACALGLFMARTAVEVWLGLERPGIRPSASSRRAALAAILLYGGSGAASGLLLLRYFGAILGLAVVIVAAVLSLVYFSLLHAHGRKTLGGEFFGVALLTLPAPAASYLLVPDLWLALRFWLVHYLFFLSGLLYVKVKIEARKQNVSVDTLSEKVRHGWPVLVYHLVLAAFVIAMANRDWIPAAAVLAFAPVVVRGFWGILRWERRLSLPRLGMSELMHSVVFALLMCIAYRVQ